MNHYQQSENVPQLFALGFAAYLYFMKPVKQNGKEFYGEANGKVYLIEDPAAEKFYHFWNNKNPEDVVNEVLKDISFWGHDLSQLKGFNDAVKNYLKRIIENGMKAELEAFHSSKTVV
jgi:tagaturonate reductase